MKEKWNDIKFLLFKILIFSIPIAFIVLVKVFKIFLIKKLF